MGEGGLLGALVEAVVRVCNTRKVAVQTIESIARGPWATSAPERATWYQPLEAQTDMDLLPMVLDAGLAGLTE